MTVVTTVVVEVGGACETWVTNVVMVGSVRGDLKLDCIETAGNVAVINLALAAFADIDVWGGRNGH